MLALFSTCFCCFFLSFGLPFVFLLCAFPFSEPQEGASKARGRPHEGAQGAAGGDHQGSAGVHGGRLAKRSKGVRGGWRPRAVLVVFLSVFHCFFLWQMEVALLKASKIFVLT